MRWRRLAIAGALGLALAAAPARTRAASSGDELVRQARAHEAAHEDDLAARRYMEALELEPRHEDAWLGLGALRLRMGEAAEAERVFQAALVRVPTLRRALEGRARARWAEGRHGEAEADLERYCEDGDLDGLRELAAWYGQDGRFPAELAVWRRLLAAATEDPAAREARRTVGALVVLVGEADPASAPPPRDPVRRGMAAMARRAGRPPSR